MGSKKKYVKNRSLSEKSASDVITSQEQFAENFVI